MTLDDNALLSYEVLCSALRYVGHSPTSGSWQNQGWRATSHQVSKMNQVKPLMSVENSNIPTIHAIQSCLLPSALKARMAFSASALWLASLWRPPALDGLEVRPAVTTTSRM